MVLKLQQFHAYSSKAVVKFVSNSQTSFYILYCKTDSNFSIEPVGVMPKT
jgi:hypothetical protein